MLVMGTVLGAELFYFGESATFPIISATPWWKVLILTVFCCTMLPVAKSWDIRGWVETNPLNGSTWSLMWEYLANIAYALVIRRLSNTVFFHFPTIHFGRVW